jgi:ABC-type Fe3+-siderophore transport system permease subunit
MARWAMGAARILPAAIAVVFAGLILFIGIFLGRQRRAYALEAAGRVIDMIRSLDVPPTDGE